MLPRAVCTGCRRWGGPVVPPFSSLLRFTRNGPDVLRFAAPVVLDRSGLRSLVARGTGDFDEGRDDPNSSSDDNPNLSGEETLRETPYAEVFFFDVTLLTLSRWPLLLALLLLPVLSRETRDEPSAG